MNKVLTSNHLIKLVLGAGLILLLSLLIFCIFQVVSMNKEALLINSYERNINELSEINKTLELNFSQVNSLKNIEIVAGRLNFEKIGRIEYIQVLEGSVATK